MPIHQTIQSFNGGEVTPYIAYLTGFDKHGPSIARMENFLPLPYGGFRKRPGTIKLASFAACPRIETFNFSTAEQFVLAFTTSELRILSPAGALVQTITATFADPFALQFAQINDLIFIAAADHLPRQLTRNADATWSLADFPFTYHPLLTENLDDQWSITTAFPDGTTVWSASAGTYTIGTRVTYSGGTWSCALSHAASTSRYPNYVSTAKSWEPGDTIPDGYYPVYKSPISDSYILPYWKRTYVNDSAVIGQEITLTSSKSTFLPEHVGSVFKISKERDAGAFEVRLSAVIGNNGVYSDSIVIQGGVSFATYGTWDGTFTIERSLDGLEWSIIRSYESNKDRNVNTEWTEEKRCLMRMKWTHETDGSSKPRGILSSTSAFISGLVQITAVANTSSATAVVLSPIEKCTTVYWTEGAFSTWQGFPVAIGVHEGRIVLAGTKRHPLGVWTSKTDDLLSFEQTTEDDGGIYIELKASQQDPIRWIASQARLFIGTAGGEWVFGSDSSDAALTPLNLLNRERTNYGSSPLPAIRINNAVYFIERQRRRLREFAYDLTRESWDAADLTRLAEHITESGLTQLAWQSNREPTLWAVRADGVALAFTYKRDEQIAAWSRHNTQGGQFRSVAALRNESGDDDVVFVVQRGSSFYLEKLAAGQQLIQETNAVTSFHYVDGAVIGATTGAANELSGLAHFEGMELNVLADGIFITAMVTAGKISLPFSAAVVRAGVPVSSTLVSLPQDIQTQDGSSHSRLKQPEKIALNLYQSYGGSVSFDGRSFDIDFCPDPTITDSPPERFTGWKEVTLSAGHVQDMVYSITHSDPYPFTVRSAVLTWNISEP